jgi:hypothetical protein
MLTEDANILLTRTGSGTSTGAPFRRFPAVRFAQQGVV